MASQQQKRIDELTKQIQQMQAQQTELMNQLKAVQQQIAVPQPSPSPGAEPSPAAAASPTAPKTIGDYVAELEKTKVPTQPAHPIPPAAWPVSGIYTAPDTKDIGQITGFEWLNGLKIRGLVDTYYEYNANTPSAAVANAHQLPIGIQPATGNAFIPSAVKGHSVTIEGRTFDVNNQSLALSEAQLELEKVPDFGGIGFDVKLFAGQTADIIFDTNNGFVGADTSTNQQSGSDRYIEQASISYIAPIGKGLRLDIGKFVTHIGAETIESVKNWNYSHGLLFTYAIPVQDTGVHLDYPWTDTFYTDLWILNGWNDTIDNNLGKTVGPTIGWTPVPWLALTSNFLYGPEQVANSAHKRWLWDSQAAIGPFGKWNFLLNYDLGYQEQANKVNFATNDHNALWTGPGVYARYAINDWLEPSIRGEYFLDRNGFTTNLNQSLFDVTLTMNTKIPIGQSGASMLLVRPELRFDHSTGDFFSSDLGYQVKQSQLTFGTGATWFF